MDMCPTRKVIYKAVSANDRISSAFQRTGKALVKAIDRYADERTAAR